MPQKIAGNNTNCLNCGNAIKGKYCTQCGQSTSIGRITFKETVSSFLTIAFAFEVHLNYDYNVLTPVGVQNHHANFLPATNWYNNMTYNDSIVYVSFTDGKFSGQPIAPGEALCEVVFDYVGGNSHLHFWRNAPESFDPKKGVTYFMSGASTDYADFLMTFSDGYCHDGKN